MERDRCWMCGGQLIVGGKFSFEDYGIEGNGIVTNLSCADCGAYVEHHVSFDDEEQSK